MQGSSSGTGEPQSGAGKEHIGRLYTLLAAFNLASVLAGVLLCHNLVASYQRSVEVNREWAGRADQVSALSRTATDANAPGNDVFESHDVPAERARLKRFTAEYEQLHGKARDGLGPLPAAQRTELTKRLEAAKRAFHAMLGEAEAIFSAFERNDPATAGRHMASMDRQLAATSSALGELSSAESQLQQAAFAKQSANAASLGNWATLLVAAVAVLVGLAVAYGRLLSRKFAAAQAAIEQRNADMQRLLDHAAQGFATIDLEGRLSPERSAMFGQLLGAKLAQPTIDEVLRVNSPEVADWMRVGLEALRDGMLPAELCLDQLPKRMQVDERHILLEYRPIPSDQPRALLMVATDITPEVERGRVEEENRETAEIFGRAMHDRDGVIEFLAEASVLVRKLRTSELTLDDEKRLLHTLKGNAALFALLSLARLCHELEDIQQESGQPLRTSDRDRLGEAWDRLVARLRRLLGDERSNFIEVDERELGNIIESVLSGQAGPQIAARLASFRLELASRRLARIGEQAQAFARRVGKPDLEIKLESNGVRLSRERWGALWSALAHVVRNAIDHGIESSDERVSRGKAASGSLTVRTVASDGRLQIAIADDGRGIDWERVRERAREAGLPHASHEDLVAALFAQGFSTREFVNEHSGRGVGLAAVAQELHRVGGSVEIDTKLGQGTVFRFSLPYEDTEVALRASLRPSGVAA
jgi:HPt (histidine-containing phosphotransfer) domain-containing protein